ncbi:TraB/GumN family protein [Algoriphagus machipongonensis]|nr:TraB/GumN family protein [Algoriphagus machipongonensis]
MSLKQLLIYSLLLLSSRMTFGQNDQNLLSVQTILFKVTNPETQYTSFLFGTHHAFGKSFFDSLSDANDALNRSDLLIKENLNIPGHLAEDIINSRSKITEWKKLLNKNDLAFIELLFYSSPTNYQKMTAAEMYTFLNRYFTQQICIDREETDTSLTLDDYIGLKAKEQGIELKGLETTEDQIELINQDVAGLPTKVHKKRLANIIEKIKSRNTTYCGQSEWYAQMDIDYELENPCENTLVLKDRNDKWMKTLEGEMLSKNCFIVVGLSHLMYDCGLINQLQNKGFIVSPISLK